MTPAGTKLQGHKLGYVRVWFKNNKIHKLQGNLGHILIFLIIGIGWMGSHPIIESSREKQGCKQIVSSNVTEYHEVLANTERRLHVAF